MDVDRTDVGRDDSVRVHGGRRARERDGDSSAAGTGRSADGRSRRRRGGQRDDRVRRDGQHDGPRVRELRGRVHNAAKVRMGVDRVALAGIRRRTHRKRVGLRGRLQVRDRKPARATQIGYFNNFRTHSQFVPSETKILLFL